MGGNEPLPPTPTPGPTPSPTAVPTPSPTPNPLSVTLNLPLSNVFPDEVCIGEFALDSTSATVTSVPSGWTFIRSDSTGSSGIADFWYWYTTVGNGNDPAAPTWGLSAASGSVSWIECIGGIDPDTPIDPNNPSGIGASDPSNTTLTGLVPPRSHLYHFVMDRSTPFSYHCNQCGRCCYDKVITLSPYDVLRIARASGLSTGEVVRRYTIRRGSILRFLPEGMCAALDGARCTLHQGRPLACRLYPLGLERTAASEHLIALEPAEGSLGIYGTDSTAGTFIDANGTAEYLAALERYRALIPTFRSRVAAMVNFERVEPREFWRRAVAEALRESGFDANPIIDTMFDPDAHGCGANDMDDTVTAHIAMLDQLARRESDSDRLAAAAVMLAVSLGYAPGEVIVAA